RCLAAMLLTAVIVICEAVLISALSAGAQQQATGAPDDSARGITLYQQGDTKGAVTALRAAVKQRKDNEVAWYYLGFALTRSGDVKGARKAHETAIKVRPDYAAAHTGLAYVLLLGNKLN